jgi:NitT/TauT family transport system permease protein
VRSEPLARVLPPLLVFIGVVLLWQLACVALALPAYLVPAPTQVAAAARANGAALATATGLTAIAALLALAISLALGTAIAVAFSQSRLLARSLYPYAIFLQTVPIVAVAPLIVIWFGTGLASVVLVAVIISLFPVITNGTTGLTRVDPQYLELFAMRDATRWQILRKLRLPGAVPYLVTGAKIASGLAVIGAIVGEFFAGYGAAGYGLGYLIVQASGQLKTAELFAAILACTLLGLLLFAAVTLLGERIVHRWRGRELDA